MPVWSPVACIWQRIVEVEQRTQTFTPVKTTSKVPASDCSELTCVVTDGSPGLTLELRSSLAAIGLTQCRHRFNTISPWPHSRTSESSQSGAVVNQDSDSGRRMCQIRHRLGEFSPVETSTRSGIHMSKLGV